MEEVSAVYCPVEGQQEVLYGSNSQDIAYVIMVLTYAVQERRRPVRMMQEY